MASRSNDFERLTMAVTDCSPTCGEESWTKHQTIPAKCHPVNRDHAQRIVIRKCRAVFAFWGDALHIAAAVTFRCMNIFSLSHLNTLAKLLPDPRTAGHPVIRLPLEKWDKIQDADHPAGEFEDHLNPYVEFEIVNWRNIKGVSAPRWVLRGLVAM
jgi:hypothetical protein